MEIRRAATGRAARRPRLLKVTCVFGIVASFLLFTYNPQFGCWLSLLGTVLVLAFSRLAWPGEWAARVGFRIPVMEILSSCVLLLVCVAVSYTMVRIAAGGAGVSFTPFFARENMVFRLVHTAGQTVNEEMVLGALLLGVVSRRCARARFIVVSVLVAVVFALLHFAFYAFRPESAVNYGILSIPALLSVFGAGVLRNNLILHYRHVGFAWAIHLGWNLVFLNSSLSAGGSRLNEPRQFNLLLGHPIMVVVVLAAMAATIVLCRKKLFAQRDRPAHLAPL